MLQAPYLVNQLEDEYFALLDALFTFIKGKLSPLNAYGCVYELLTSIYLDKH